MGNLFNYVDEFGNIIPALVNRGTRAQNVRRILDVNNIPDGPSLDGLDFPFGASNIPSVDPTRAQNVRRILDVNNIPDGPSLEGLGSPFGARGIPSVDPVSVAEEVVVPDIDYGTLLRGMGMDRSRPNLGGSPPNRGGGLVPASPTSRATFSNGVTDVDAVEILNQISSSRGRPIPGGGLVSSPNVRQTSGGGGGGRSGPPPNNTLQAPTPGGRGVGLNTIYEDYRGLPGWALPAAVGGSIAAGYGYSQLPLGNDQEQSDKPPSSPTPKATPNSSLPSPSPSPSPSPTQSRSITQTRGTGKTPQSVDAAVLDAVKNKGRNSGGNVNPPSTPNRNLSNSPAPTNPSPTAAPSNSAATWTPEWGDTLYSKFGGDWDKINAFAALNEIDDPNKIYANRVYKMIADTPSRATLNSALR